MRDMPMKAMAAAFFCVLVLAAVGAYRLVVPAERPASRVGTVAERRCRDLARKVRESPAPAEDDVAILRTYCNLNKWQDGVVMSSYSPY